MMNAFDDVYLMHKEKQVNMRKSAYIVGVGRIAEAYKARGWIKDWTMPIQCKA